MVSDNMIIYWGKNERKLGVGLHKSLYIFYMVCVKDTNKSGFSSLSHRYSYIYYCIMVSEILQ